jgi:hypothetical protein
MPDGGRAQRPATVRSATVITIMLTSGAVLNEQAPGAVIPASV